MIKQLEFFTKFYGKLTQKEKVIFYFAAAAVAVVLCDRLIIGPVFTKIASLNEDVILKEEALRRDSRIVAQKERINAEVDRYKSFLGTSSLNEQEGMTTLLKQLEGFANKSKLYIVDMKPVGVKEEKDKTRRFQVNISCEGLMEQVMEFMYTVENSSELLVIEKYQISPKSKDTGIAQCSMTISKIAL